MRYNYKTEGVCSQNIAFDLDDSKVTNIEFIGGCNGNLKAISKILNGWTVEQINTTLAGNTCGIKKTSCADQLAKAVKMAYEESKKQY